MTNWAVDQCCVRLQVLTFERLPAPTPLHSEGVLPPLPAVPKGHPFPALAALSRLEVSLQFVQTMAPALTLSIGTPFCHTPVFLGPTQMITSTQLPACCRSPLAHPQASTLPPQTECRIPSHLLPREYNPAFTAGRHRLQGYWTGCYGPHGLEIIYLRLADGGEPGEQHCPCAATPRLVCMKVLLAFEVPGCMRGSGHTCMCPPCQIPALNCSLVVLSTPHVTAQAHA